MHVIALRAALIGAVLAAWEFAAQNGLLDPEVLPPLSAVAVSLLRLLGSAQFQQHASVTAARIGAAFLLAAPIALACGLLIGEKIAVRRIMSPVIYFALSIPQSIFLPIFILLFGIGFVQKLIFGMTHVFFVVALNAAAAVRSVPSSYLLAARSFGASRGQIYRVFYLPAMLPVVITGLRLGLIFDVIGVLLAEMYASREGLGMLIFIWGDQGRTKEMLACVLLISVVTILLNELMRFPETRLNRWRLSEAAR